MYQLDIFGYTRDISSGQKGMLIDLGIFSASVGGLFRRFLLILVGDLGEGQKKCSGLLTWGVGLW